MYSLNIEIEISVFSYFLTVRNCQRKNIERTTDRMKRRIEDTKTQRFLDENPVLLKRSSLGDKENKVRHFPNLEDSKRRARIHFNYIAAHAGKHNQERLSWMLTFPSFDDFMTSHFSYDNFGYGVTRREHRNLFSINIDNVMFCFCRHLYRMSFTCTPKNCLP